MLDALREAEELMKRGEFGEPLADVLHVAHDLLDIIAGYVEYGLRRGRARRVRRVP